MAFAESECIFERVTACADPAMPAGCPTDLNADSAVVVSNFIVLAGVYNNLVCP